MKSLTTPTSERETETGTGPEPHIPFWIREVGQSCGSILRGAYILDNSPRIMSSGTRFEYTQDSVIVRRTKTQRVPSWWIPIVCKGTCLTAKDFRLWRSKTQCLSSLANLQLLPGSCCPWEVYLLPGSSFAVLVGSCRMTWEQLHREPREIPFAVQDTRGNWWVGDGRRNVPTETTGSEGKWYVVWLLACRSDADWVDIISGWVLLNRGVWALHHSDFIIRRLMGSGVDVETYSHHLYWLHTQRNLRPFLLGKLAEVLGFCDLVADETRVHVHTRCAAKDTFIWELVCSIPAN